MKHIDLEIEITRWKLFKRWLSIHGSLVSIVVYASIVFSIIGVALTQARSAVPCIEGHPCTEQAKRQYCERYQSKDDVRCTGFFVK